MKINDIFNEENKDKQYKFLKLIKKRVLHLCNTLFSSLINVEES